MFDKNIFSSCLNMNFFSQDFLHKDYWKSSLFVWKFNSSFGWKQNSQNQLKVFKEDIKYISYLAISFYLFTSSDRKKCQKFISELWSFYPCFFWMVPFIQGKGFKFNSDVAFRVVERYIAHLFLFQN